MEWRREEVVSLIYCYQKHPCLWNAKLKGIKYKDRRDVAMRKIHQELYAVNSNISEDKIRKKIHTLRGQYTRELKFKRDSGADTDDVYTPKLWCFNLLHFLQDDDIRQVKSSLDTVEMEETFTSQDFEDVQETQSPLPTSDTSETPSRTPTPIPSTSTHTPRVTSSCTLDDNINPCSSQQLPRTPKNKRELEPDATEELFAAAVNRFSSPRGEEDAFKAFGASVGFELRTINKQNSMQCKLAKKIIHEVLFMASTETLTLDTKVLDVNVSNMFSM